MKAEQVGSKGYNAETSKNAGRDSKDRKLCAVVDVMKRLASGQWVQRNAVQQIALKHKMNPEFILSSIDAIAVSDCGRWVCLEMDNTPLLPPELNEEKPSRKILIEFSELIYQVCKNKGIAFDKKKILKIKKNTPLIEIEKIANSIGCELVLDLIDKN